MKRTHEQWMHLRLVTKAESLEEKARIIRMEAESWLRPVLWYTVQKSDVGKPNPIGGTYLSIDVGKRLYMDQGQIMIENQDQLNRRLYHGNGG